MIKIILAGAVVLSFVLASSASSKTLRLFVFELCGHGDRHV